MKKFYSLLAAITLSTVAVNAQEGTTTVTISLEEVGAELFNPSGNYSYQSGEVAFELNDIGFGAKAVGQNAGVSTQIKTKPHEGVFYNTEALPGRIVSIEISGSAAAFDIYAGNEGRLVNDASGNYNVTGGVWLNEAAEGEEQVGSSTGWDEDFFEDDYTWFALKRVQSGTGSGSNGYHDYIKITYVDPLGIEDIEAPKVTLVRNTVVNDEIIFGTDAKVAIYNTAGKLVKTAEVSENSQLNVSDFAVGTYIVTATVNGKAISEKIIKK